MATRSTRFRGLECGERVGGLAAHSGLLRRILRRAMQPDQPLYPAWFDAENCHNRADDLIEDVHPKLAVLRGATAATRLSRNDPTIALALEARYALTSYSAAPGAWQRRGCSRLTCQRVAAAKRRQMSSRR
jgi:hypothetical protein